MDSQEAEAHADLLSFAPVPRKCKRHDGWTPERQRTFIGALADTGCVSRAAKAAGMASEGAYMLRRQPGAEDFCRAWTQALDRGVQRLRDIAFERAIEGVPVPIFQYGRQVGERRQYNDRLLMFTLRHHDPEERTSGIGARISPATRQALKAELETEIRAELAAEQAAIWAVEDADELAAAREVERRIDHVRKQKGITVERVGPFAHHPDYAIVTRRIQIWTCGGSSGAQAERILGMLGVRLTPGPDGWWVWDGTANGG